MAKKKCLAVTLGDPAGVGAEVILSALSNPRILRSARFIICGHQEILEAAWECLQAAMDKKLRPEVSPLAAANVSIYEPAPLRGTPPRPGKWSRRTGRLSLTYVDAAIRLCLDGEAAALVTAPISKVAWQRAGCAHPGHTEYLAAATKSASPPLMLLVGGGLRVALATVHVPLAKVPGLISGQKIIQHGLTLQAGLRKFFRVSEPRIAILGLNPHAGEAGCIGKEEVEIIAPAVAALQKKGVRAVGPLPGDTAFHFARRGEYDGVLAMYHDQGLAPLKTVAFDTGVNITLGLPIIRTSVDHGTAFDIAGLGQANSRSCAAAIRTALAMIRAAQRI